PPRVVNDATAGPSRVDYGVMLPVSIQASGVEACVKGLPIGQIKIGGGAAGGATALSVAGSGPGNGSDQSEVTNLYTYEDQLQISRGIHSLKTGVWFERLQNTEFNLT